MTDVEIGEQRRGVTFEEHIRVHFWSVKSLSITIALASHLNLILEDACYSKLKHPVSHLHLFIIEK